MGLQLVKLLDPIALTIAGTFTHKGDYDNGTDYAVGDAVNYQGSGYIMHTNAAAGTLPTDATKWYKYVDKGDTGANGAAGAAGAQGPQGDPGADGEDGADGVVQSIVAGNNIDVDATDPANPIVSVETLTPADIGTTSSAAELDILDGATLSTTELNYVDGVTSAIQTQLNAKIDDTERGAANGVASLGAGGTIPVAEIATGTANVNRFARGDGTWSQIGGNAVATNTLALGKLTTIATATILGRNTAGTGDVEELSASTTKTLLSLNNVDNTSDATKNAASVTLTNKTIDGDDNTIQDLGDGVFKSTADVLKGMLGLHINGGGSAITTGLKGYIHVPYNCTITKWVLLGVTSGSCTIDIWLDSYANYPPTVADTITAAAKPAIAASGVKNESSTLTGWTTTLSQGDVLGINVDAVSGLTELQVILEVRKT